MRVVRTCHETIDAIENDCMKKLRMIPGSTITTDSDDVQEQHMFYKRDAKRFLQNKLR